MKQDAFVDRRRYRSQRLWRLSEVARFCWPIYWQGCDFAARKNPAPPGIELQRTSGRLYPWRL